VEAVLRQHGFDPCTAKDGSVELHNCPFHQLVATHQELVCGMNLALMQGLMSGMDSRGMRASLDPKPGRCCVVIAPPRRAGPPTEVRS
jgi:predicted ArsR family transcriptional regulator